MEEYIKHLEDGLINALDEMCSLYKELGRKKDFDYFDKLCDLSGMGNTEALNYLDKYSEND